MTFHPDSLPDLGGKIFIVTGGTSGLGYHTAARLAQHGAHVYICGRSKAKCEKAIAEMKELDSNAHISFLQMDHLSIVSVVAAADEFLSKETALHGLINNAGIMATPFEMTNDGYEAQWQTNHVSHWLFTTKLIPLLLKTSMGLPSGSVRIVNVSSVGHRSAPKEGIDFDDTSLPHASVMARYGQSKLANALHAKTLHDNYGPGSPSCRAGRGEIWTSIVDPGLVKTQLGSKPGFPHWITAVAHVLGFFGGMFDADRGSWTSLFCAASPEMTAEQSGLYFERIARPGESSSQAKDSLLAERLESWTRDAMVKHGWVDSIPESVV